jgi:NAD(P)-dependent dehydrogenase (short-subunit alcohol dehydrogenase family)
MPFDLKGRAVLVTGGGRGIGRATAELMARYGAVVGVADRDAATASAAAAAIRAAGGQAHVHVGDLGEQAAFEAVADAFAGIAGGIDGVVNAAMWIRYEPAVEVTEEIFDGMLAVGLKAPMWGAQAVIRHKPEGALGWVTNFTSPAAMQGYPNTSVYAAVKGAVATLTRTLAVELGPQGIRVNAVTPGPVPTPGARAVVDEAGYELRRRKTPLGRLGTEEDIANACAFLASDEASFVTGAILNVDGGCSLTAS